MKDKKTYYDWLFEESEEEKEIHSLLDQERERYESTEAYKEHQRTLDTLLDELVKAGKRRREKAKEHRPSRNKAKPVKVDMEAFRRENEQRYQEKFKTYPEALQRAITAYNELDETQKKVFARDTWVYHSEHDQFENPQTTKQDIRELLDILVQTTIDFIMERGLKDIDSVGFGADSLQESARFGEWTPATDASIHVYGMGYETSKDGTKYAVEKKIGDYM